MKRIDLMIGQLSKFNEIVETPVNLEADDDAIVFDLVMKLDTEYYKRIDYNRKGHEGDFMDKKIASLLQLLWDPSTGEFYDDVGVEARTAAPESKLIKIRQDWSLSLPDNAWVVLNPDAGC